MGQKYSWSYANSADAEKAAAHIKKLEAEHGTVTPELVLADAARLGSPLHPMFEWDDSEAARKYRLHQAGLVLRNVRVEYAGNAEPIRVRAFVSIGKNQYQSVEAAIQERPQYLLDEALRELMQFKRKYEGLQELSEIFALIGQVAV